MSREFVTIVAGLPRSGTSLMMQAIEAGGIPALTDHVRQADEDNPRGYYEYEPVKRTKEDPSWVPGAVGQVVKMVYRLLYDLPAEYPYRVVFTQRDLEEVLASQGRMLERLGKTGGDIDDARMADLFRRQIEEFRQWVAGRPNFSVLYVHYRDMVDRPAEQAKRVNQFLGGDLDTRAMAAVVDPTLYRNRRG